MTATRTALVSGANRGIGFEIVRQLARLGVLAVIGARDPEDGAKAAEKLQSEGLEVPVVALDVDREDSAAEAVADVKRLYGRLDILVNNAAILIDEPGGFNASFFDLKSDTVRRTMETNLLGPIRLIQAALPLMREQDYGRIVNVSSIAGQLAEMGSGYPAYRMSKTALNALTRLTASEIGPGDIKVNSMCPGWVRTDMGGANAERTVEEGADTAVWLATLPEDGPTGGFFRDRKPLAW
ncbi:short-chain dehydrogenase [Hyphomicrobium nitrativorans NL23]|uniref:Short-chain dehydrogenase n=1 Tax=Hyphomicrobium nitrativorans NL23 TaxID=1029756 RepID=V5SDG0_9HYPH|nr:SDR family oxidoreductase [Hyphomicrobium nitrativorans]AHB48527.1 short-chain dehydrogenase [Hyphomicrobium nitrativorans NL23]